MESHVRVQGDTLPLQPAALQQRWIQQHRLLAAAELRCGETSSPIQRRSQ
jgi:hypothetical protein